LCNQHTKHKLQNTVPGRRTPSCIVWFDSQLHSYLYIIPHRCPGTQYSPTMCRRTPARPGTQYSPIICRRTPACPGTQHSPTVCRCTPAYPGTQHSPTVCRRTPACPGTQQSPTVFRRTPACPGTQYSPTVCTVEIIIQHLLALSYQWRHCLDNRHDCAEN